MLPITWLFATILAFTNPEKKSKLYNSIFIVGCTGECSWLLGLWFILFKYWQMSYELQYLFCLENEARNNKHHQLYVILNVTVFLTIFASLYCSIVGKFSLGILILFLLALFIYAPLCFDAVRRMNNIMK